MVESTVIVEDPKSALSTILVFPVILKFPSIVSDSSYPINNEIL